ncbi:dephospho-CoA kinase [Chitiniphilus eburneus]|uniref:Dephospho-CoA kinase n=1 Tax=Chitiniphilus eburneus TaxID=2571148 RepID=A0A4U0QB89_9NEIS|nr:dephospho-CoA kinase [Chitiniphilus eburneus]TJZ73094.1 dephospho-CoA kinase [Chitiniphilus eburneus]
MKVIGLTGGIGSGKSTVAAMFAKLGVPVVDTDEIAHQLSLPPSDALDEIRQTFGGAFLQADGTLDRARMRALVFQDENARIRLNEIFHPRIRNAARQALLALAPFPYALLVVPLLFEANGFRSLVDRALVVDSPPDQQLERLAARPGLDRATAEGILRSQLAPSERIALADDVISNGGSLSELQRQVQACHAQYLEWANDL